MLQFSFFDHSDFLSHLSTHRDPLEKLNAAINWEAFRKPMNELLCVERKSNAGRTPFDYVLMLKVLVLQSLYGLSDQQVEFQILDRYTFKRFLGISSESEVPDEKTIWLFREKIGEKGARALFDQFSVMIDAAGLTAKKGSMVDASFVDAPRQRNSRDENEQIKNGGGAPKEWSANKLRQKDTDARWTKKNDEKHFGYKNHACADVKNKLIRDYAVTAANVHDSQVFEVFFPIAQNNGTHSVYADSAYRSEQSGNALEYSGLRNRVIEKGYRNKPLTDAQKIRNRLLSAKRARIEHLFGRMKQLRMDTLRCIGIARASMRIGFSNLVYNMDRYAILGGRA